MAVTVASSSVLCGEDLPCEMSVGEYGRDLSSLLAGCSLTCREFQKGLDKIVLERKKESMRSASDWSLCGRVAWRGHWFVRGNICDCYTAVNLRRIPARFSRELWNVHQATVNDCPRTNNLCEEWNNKFYNLVGYQHPSIWKLRRMIQKEEAVVSAVITRDLVGELPIKKTKKIYVEQQQGLKNLCSGYVKGRENPDQILSGLSHNMHTKRNICAITKRGTSPL